MVGGVWYQGRMSMVGLAGGIALKGFVLECMYQWKQRKARRLAAHHEAIDAEAGPCADLPSIGRTIRYSVAQKAKDSGPILEQ